MRLTLKASFPAKLLFACLPILVGAAGAATVSTSVHPGWSLINLRPAGFQPQVSGMAFQSDGKLVIADWNSLRGLNNHDANQVAPRGYGSRIYLLSGVTGNNPNVTVDTIATGLEDVMGLTLVNDTIYVSGGNAILRLIRAGGLAGPVTRRDTVFFLPGTPVNGDSLKPDRGLQEYFFGLLYRAGKFYAVPSSLDPSTQNTVQINPYRGTLLEITLGNGTTDKRGSYRILAKGLREPSGMAFGPDGTVCTSDNQGEWLPSSKFNCISTGNAEPRYYGARKTSGANNYYVPWDTMTETPPTAWAVHNDIGNSPTAPSFAPAYTPYSGQAFSGDVRWGTGLNRYFLEKNSLNELQAVIFPFTGGLEAGSFRMVWGPDSMLYIGMIGGKDDQDGWPKNQASNVRMDYGLQKLRYNKIDTAFEMRAIRSRPTGFEIEFSAPVDSTLARNAANYTVQSYSMVPSATYGGGSKSGTTTLTPLSISLSPDKRKVFLEYTGLVPSVPTAMRVIYFKINNFLSATGSSPWSTEAWYTLNALGTGNPFDNPVALRAPADGADKGASAMHWKLQDGFLTVSVQTAGAYDLVLRDLRGRPLAAAHGEGPGERSWNLTAVRAPIAVLEIRGAGPVFRRLVNLR